MSTVDSGAPQLLLQRHRRPDDRPWTVRLHTRALETWALRKLRIPEPNRRCWRRTRTPPIPHRQPRNWNLARKLGRPRSLGRPRGPTWNVLLGHTPLARSCWNEAHIYVCGLFEKTVQRSSPRSKADRSPAPRPPLPPVTLLPVGGRTLQWHNDLVFWHRRSTHPYPPRPG